MLVGSCNDVGQDIGGEYVPINNRGQDYIIGWFSYICTYMKCKPLK